MTDWSSLKTLIVSRDEMKDLVSLEEVIDLVEQAFRAHGQGKYLMDPKVHILVPEFHGEWEAMPSYLKEPESSACKWVAIREKNRPKFGLPTILSTIVYTDPESGFPLMICDGTYHTNMRTGASAAVSARWLARKDARRVALVGSGAVAVGAARAMDALGAYETMSVWSRTQENAETFVEKMAPRLRVPLTVAKSAEAAVREADVVVTTTLATEPLVRSEWVRPGTHIAALGADMEGKQELETELVQRAKVFVDDLGQCVRDGEINVPLEKGELRVEDLAGTIGEVIAGKKAGRESAEEITVFDSTGIALQDAAVITLEYQRARERGVGIEKRMIGTGFADL